MGILIRGGRVVDAAAQIDKIAGCLSGRRQ